MPVALHPLPLQLLPLGLALAAAAAAAQTPGHPAPPAPVVGRSELHVIGDVGTARPFGFAGYGEAERVIKGAPYCAEAVHESVQWLPDASGAANNRIVNRQSTRLCRDGEGRTRQEVDRGGRKLVYLGDPVAGQYWVLDIERKTARTVARPLLNTDGAAGGPGGRVVAERLRDWAQDLKERTLGLTDRGQPVKVDAASAMPLPPQPPAAPEVPTPVVITRQDSTAAGGPQVQVIQVQRGEAGDMAFLPPLPVQWRAQLLAPRGAGSTTPLGSKEVEGVPAHGERTTWLIEAGKVGNERPIQITREVWTSPDLMVTVQSRDFDPRSGEVSYRLTQLKRGEPDAASMRVPADFSTSGPPAALRRKAPASESSR